MSDEVEHLRGEITRIELRMLEEPELVEALRPLRDEALEALRSAEAAEQEPRPTPIELAEEWRGIRFLRGSQLSARTKAYLLRRVGPKLYRSMPW